MNCMPLCVEIAASRFVSVSDLTAVVKLDYNVTTINKEDLVFCLIDEESKTVKVVAIFNAKKDYTQKL